MENNLLTETTENSKLRTLLNETLIKLEWHKLMQYISDFSILSFTKNKFLNLVPWMERTEAEQWQSGTEEMIKLQESGARFDLLPFVADEFVPKLRREAHLAPLELYDILIILKSCQKIHTLFSEEKNLNQNLFPILKQSITHISVLSHLMALIETSIDRQGEILSDASPELKSARARAHNAGKKVEEKLDSLLKINSIKDACQESMWTSRDGHYVLPIKIEKRNQVEGILRGISGSGSTVFIEPLSLSVEVSQLERALGDVQIEEFKVIVKLSQQCAEHIEQLEENIRILYLFDDFLTRSKAAIFLRAEKCFLLSENNSNKFEFIHAKHPLFLFEKKPCVASDLILNHEHVLVISGPNAGGKSVSMKTMGLFTLMIKAGFFIPCLSGKAKNFNHVFVDIGDGQNREEDLSTFSSHIHLIGRMISECTENSLILLDELFVGTDPVIGMALARATLEHLASKKITVIVTTHYPNLKLLAENNSDFCNASMEFEYKTLSPTFRFLNHIPGQSYALELAERLKFPLHIVTLARTYLGKDTIEFEKLLLSLKEKNSELANKILEQSQLQKKLEDELELINKDRDQLEHTRKLIIENFKTKFSKKISDFEETLQLKEEEKKLLLLTALEPIRHEMKEKLKTVEGIINKLPQKEKDLHTLNIQQESRKKSWKKGMRIKTKDFQEPGVILIEADAKGMVYCQFGLIKMKVHENKLLTLEEASKKSTLTHIQDKFKINSPKKSVSKKTENKMDESVAGVLQHSQNTIDLRGRTVDDALYYLEHELDKMFSRGEEYIVIIHGHGFGKLKAAVRDFVTRADYQLLFRSGKQGEGGDGVTIVQFAK